MSKLRDIQPGDYEQLSRGTVEYQTNEMHLHSADDDPSGVSFHNDHGNHLGKLSGKHNGREHALLQFKRNADGGEIYIGLLDEALYNKLVASGDPDPLDHATIEVINMTVKGIEFRVPVKFSAGGGSPVPPTDGNYDGAQFNGSEGKFVYARQTDGHDVLYKRRADGQLTAIWTSDGGENGTWLNP